jgi:hypothetical protein
MLLYALFSATFSVIFGFGVLVKIAPFGYEDKWGFHYGFPPPVKRKGRKK